MSVKKRSSLTSRRSGARSRGLTAAAVSVRWMTVLSPHHATAVARRLPSSNTVTCVALWLCRLMSDTGRSLLTRGTCCQLTLRLVDNYTRFTRLLKAHFVWLKLRRVVTFLGAEYRFSSCLQRVRIARSADRSKSHGLSVWPSITFRCFVQTNEDTIVRFPASGRTIILVSADVKFIRIFAGGHPSKGVKVKRPLSLSKIWQITCHISETVQDRR